MKSHRKQVLLARHQGRCLVARCRDLRAVRAELRRRRRRRDRRPGRRPRPAAVPGRPRHRRDLVQPVVSLPEVRRGLRRRRLPLHRPRLRHPGRRRRADRRGPRARHQDDHRHRAEPLLGSAPVVPGRAGGRARITRTRQVLVPPRPRSPGETCRRTTGGRSSAAPPGPGRRPRTAPPASGTCTCSRPSSRTSTGPTRRSGPSSRTSCGSGSTAAPTASGSTPPPC